MKTLILSMLVLIIASLCKAQNVNIPDTDFLHALIDEGVDTNGDSLISYAEAEAVISLDVSGWICNEYGCYYRSEELIESLEGIEAFTNLDSLDCTDNKLSNLDLLGCNALKYLDCSYNQLTSLDITNNISLTELICHDNGLTTLNVYNNSGLKILVCGFSGLGANGGNQLTSLDVSNNINLEILHCDKNQLTSLDVSNNTQLKGLRIGDNPDLGEVCVWEGFSEDRVQINLNESPNVYFTTGCSVTEINNNQENSTINIYPNPSNDVLNIEINNTGNQYLEIEILTIAGQVIFQKEYRNTNTHFAEQIDLSDHTKGIYLIKVKQADTVYVGKVVVR